jgi:LCP family protein required for cell wall assembly
MSNYHSYDDDFATRKAEETHYPGLQRSPQQPSQDKLILGGGGSSYQRRPYQYQPEQPTKAARSDPQQATQRGNNSSYGYQQPPQRGNNNPNSYPYQPSPNHNGYPQDAAYQPLSSSNPPGSFQPERSAQPPQKRRRNGRGGCRTGCGIGCLGMAVIILIALFITVPMANRVLAFGKAISTQDPLSTQNNYMNTSKRTNLLVIGYGGGSHDGAYLTDSLVVISIIPETHHTSLISVPRDLWVQNPPDSGNYSKINALYTVTSKSNKDPVAGGDALAKKVSIITGLDIKYWMTIDFQGFRQLIDSIGGIDVYVPNSFTSDYPKNDDPKIDASWIQVHFDKGTQHMNGETAIRYARARYVTDNPAESTDFARSARQQIMMKAVLAKLKDNATWPHIYDAMDALQKAIYTNLSLVDLGQFQLKMDLNDAASAKIGLSNQNVLMDSTISGQAVLVPQNNDWSRIPTYIQSKLYN